MHGKPALHAMSFEQKESTVHTYAKEVKKGDLKQNKLQELLDKGLTRPYAADPAPFSDPVISTEAALTTDSERTHPHPSGLSER